MRCIFDDNRELYEETVDKILDFGTIWNRDIADEVVVSVGDRLGSSHIVTSSYKNRDLRISKRVNDTGLELEGYIRWYEDEVSTLHTMLYGGGVK